jgi:hypothetical protein
MTKQRARLWLIIATVCYVPAGLVTLVLAPFMGFLYDAGDFGEHASLDTFFVFGVTLWATFWFSASVPWVFYFFKKYRVAAALTLLPVPHVAVMVIAGAFWFE